MVTTTWNEAENIKDLILKVRKALKDTPHEIIVVDDTSPDGTFEIAKHFADVAVSKARKGQTEGLLFGMHIAKFPLVVTIDADLENDPEYILTLAEKCARYDLVVASRTVLPRVSEKLASKTLGKIIGVSDFFSNFRAYRREIINRFNLSFGESFGGELLVNAKKNALRIAEIMYEPPPRRRKARIGGKIRANTRIMIALIKCLIAYLA